MGLSIEEVKKALKQCKLAGPCGDCPLKEDDECVRIMKAEAIKAIEDLEKRNEPKQPKWFTDIHNPAGAYKCGVCEERIVEKDVDFYCPNCGQAVKWE